MKIETATNKIDVARSVREQTHEETALFTAKTDRGGNTLEIRTDGLFLSAPLETVEKVISRVRKKD